MTHRRMTWWQRFRCNTLGWHKKPYIFTGHDGASFQATCPRCGYRGLVDSQGNLF